jgi:hypothetical protein
MRNHTWVTTYGCVNVSEQEAALLHFCAKVPAYVRDSYPNLFAQADALKADCDRVAKWRFDHA